MYIHRILEEREHIPSSDKVIGEALLTEMTSTPSSTSMSSERLKNLIKLSSTDYLKIASSV